MNVHVHHCMSFRVYSVIRSVVVAFQRSTALVSINAGFRVVIRAFSPCPSIITIVFFQYQKEKQGKTNRRYTREKETPSFIIVFISHCSWQLLCNILLSYSGIFS